MLCWRRAISLSMKAITRRRLSVGIRVESLLSRVIVISGMLSDALMPLIDQMLVDQPLRQQKVIVGAELPVNRTSI